MFCLQEHGYARGKLRLRKNSKRSRLEHQRPAFLALERKVDGTFSSHGDRLLVAVLLHEEARDAPEIFGCMSTKRAAFGQSSLRLFGDIGSELRTIVFAHHEMRGGERFGYRSSLPPVPLDHEPRDQGCGVVGHITNLCRPTHKLH